MKKLLLPALMAALLPACGANDPSALNEYDDVGTADKADSTNSSSTYYLGRYDLRRCVFPICGGVWVKRANRAQTQCADGNYADECYVPEVNLSASGLSGEAATEFQGMFEGGKALVRGRIARKYFPGFGTMGVLTSVPVSSQYDNGVWRAASDTASTEPYRLVRDSGVRCITQPCPSLHQAWLNMSSNYTQYHSNLVGLDLGSVAASEADKQLAMSLSSKRVLAQGKLASVRGGYQLVASQFYLPYQYKAPAAACVTDGCSGTICRDENDDPVITTCEWRPEYACYGQYGHCERQSDGSCGWSQTRDFLACLQNPPL